MSLEDFKPIENVSRKIVKNTVYNIIGNFTLLSVGFLLVPYIIKHIGIGMYGNVWVIAIVIISLSQMLDMGIGSACTKYISEYYTKSELINLNKIVNTSFFFFLILWIVLYTLILIFRSTIIQIIGTAPEFQNDMQFVLLVISGVVAINHITAPFYSSINAIQRYDILNVSFIISSLVNVTFVVLFLQFGWGVKGVAASYFIFYLIVAASSTFFAFKKIKGLELNPAFTDIAVLKKILTFGGNLQISRLAQIFVFQLDKFLTLKFFGGNTTAFYDIGSKITALTRSIPLLLVSAIVPVASELDAKGEKQKLKKLFETGTRYLVLFGFVISGFVFANANLIVQSWVGKKLTMEGISIASSILRFLIIGYFVNMLTGAMNTIAIGLDRTEFERRSGILMIIIFPVLIFILIGPFEYFGIALAASFTILISSIYYMLQFLKAINLTFLHILKIAYKPFGVTLLSSISTLGIFYLIPDSFLDTRIEGLVVVVCLFLIYCILFTLLVIVFKLYHAADLDILKMFTAKLRIKTTQEQ